METALQSNRKLSFFVIIGLIGLFGAFTGFAGTFFIPVAQGSFKAPSTIYIHGAFAFSWIILFVMQTFLIHFQSYRTHIILGTAGVFIALGTAITMVPAGVFAVQKSLANGLGEFAYSEIFGTLTSGILFLTLVFLSIYNRRKAAVHKRFMLLATIVVLWPAWFRFRHFFPGVPRPDIWFGVVLSDSLIILSWIFDKRINGKVHPVLLWGGIAIIIENIIEINMFNSDLWRYLGKQLYHLIA